MEWVMIEIQHNTSKKYIYIGNVNKDFAQRQHFGRNVVVLLIESYTGCRASGAAEFLASGHQDMRPPSFHKIF